MGFITENQLRQNMAYRQGFYFKFDDIPASPTQLPTPVAGDYAGGPVNQNGVYPQSRVAPGWHEPTDVYDKFLTRFSFTTPILDNSRHIQMDTLQKDLSYLLADVEFSPERTGIVGGISQNLAVDYGGTSDKNADGSFKPGVNRAGTDYSFKRKQLLAIPLATYTTITDNFLQENIEKQGFLNSLIDYLGQKAGPSAESIFLYSRLRSSTEAYAGNINTAYTDHAGLFQQLEEGNNQLDHAIGSDDSYLIGIEDLVNSFTEDDGEIQNAVIYAPALLLNKIRQEISGRETVLGDQFMVDPITKITTFNGVPIYPSKNLNGPGQRNNRTVQPIAGKEPIPPRAIITERDNIVWGSMRDITVQAEYFLLKLAYVVVLRTKLDMTYLFDEGTKFANIEWYDQK
jgi:hypothetical protein